jgi:hypothetical protein
MMAKTDLWLIVALFLLPALLWPVLLLLALVEGKVGKVVKNG